MIEIRDDVKTGDMVYFWFSTFNDKKNKNKPKEVEMKVIDMRDGSLTIKSITAGYYLKFDKEMIRNWFGCCRKIWNDFINKYSGTDLNFTEESLKAFKNSYIDELELQSNLKYN